MPPKDKPIDSVLPQNPNKKKFDFSGVIESVQKDAKKLASKVSLGSTLKPLEDKDYLKLGEWFEKGTGLKGIAYGRLTVVSGDSDTGKTSFAIQCIKAAQEQGTIVILGDSEKKTSSEDLECWGVDPSQIVLSRSIITEELLELVKRSAKSCIEKFPNEKILIVIDSIGNNVSIHDMDIDLTEDNQQMGGKSKTIRLALGQMIAMTEENPNIALLLINYNYESIGTYGPPTKIPAGGKSIKFYSSLTFFTSRKGWVEKTVAGEKVRVGADVIFKLDKNHLTKNSQGKKQITFRITKEGMDFLEAKEED